MYHEIEEANARRNAQKNRRGLMRDAIRVLSVNKL